MENPSFEVGFLEWGLYTPSDMTPLPLYILPGYVGNSAVMVSNESGYRGGLRQTFRNVPPNTTFHFKSMIKTVDIDTLEVRVLGWSIIAGGVWHSGGELGFIQGSNDWTIYEVSFTSPDVVSRVSFYPALVYNRGEVWIDEVSVTIDGFRPPTTTAILDYLRLHDPFRPNGRNSFRTNADIEFVEQGLKTVPIRNFWGIYGPVCEEHYRTHIEFNDDVNTTYFGEVMLGYPLYLLESPGATVNQWKDEMYLRMIRGFYNYFHPLTKVGITANGGSTVESWKNQWTGRGIPYFFGWPAMDFIRENYDFVSLYPYTETYEQFMTWTKQYFDVIDQLWGKQKKFWKITPIWRRDDPAWQDNILALEMKNCFDRNIAVLYWSETDPPETWDLMLKARELYNARAPYTESIVYDTSLLTGFVGDTYGWVANPEHDEGLYPTPIFPLKNIILPALIIGGVYYFGSKGSK